MKKRVLVCFLILAGLWAGHLRAEEKILNGRVLAVNRKFNFVIVNLGRQDGIKKGMRFMAHRDKKLLGKVEVEEVFPEMSSCIILPGWKKDAIKVDDGVLLP